jgi:hypothetical protein
VRVVYPHTESQCNIGFFNSRKQQLSENTANDMNHELICITDKSH